MTSTPVRVDSYARRLPRRTAAVNRTVISATEFDAMERELKSELLSGANVTSKKAQRTKQDVQSGKNVCCRTILTILTARAAAGEDRITVTEFADKVRALVARCYPEFHNPDFKAVQQLETNLESAMNPLQMMIQSGDASRVVWLQLRRVAVQYREALDELLECIDAKLNAAPAFTLVVVTPIASWAGRGQVATCVGAVLLAWWIVATDKPREIAPTTEREQDDEREKTSFAPQHSAANRAIRSNGR